ncbi:uncharacterized protein LOC110187729 [Drosophila serrata]|uniref:uncharacterized protein LOC110187729 n=1 Tax=Drosophila serrata TaxID=7274 RepID=UPI000A1D185A|nr:uncharacterized protein LOC110187729 [Drosophila serrata]
MDTTNNQYKLLKPVPKNTKGSEEISQLRKLIVEVMKPKLAQLRQILGARIISATRDYYDDESEDWWPDYEIFSEFHAISDMNGFLVLTQNALKGLPEDLKSIRKKLDHAYLAAKPKNVKTKTKKFCLVEELIEDLINFVTNFSRFCTRILEDRRILHDMAAQTLDTADRIKVKIFDERTFVQFQTRIAGLRNYIRDFCALFNVPVETKEEAAIEPHTELHQGPLRFGAVDKAQR